MKRCFRLERDVDWPDPFGRSIKVDRIVEVIDVVAAGTLPANNGYFDYEAKVWVHLPTGRTFWKPQVIDYSGTDRMCSHDGGHWVDRLSTGRRYIDAADQPITLSRGLK